ncbi:MAG TPA: hypothetical protein VGR18_11750 [Rubrobacter sp.]|nr:hypothetical protein [Rubrobacter sp.]
MRPVVEEGGYRRTRHFAVEGRYPRDIRFEDGGYAGTVAMGLLVKDRPAASGA